MQSSRSFRKNNFVFNIFRCGLECVATPLLKSPIYDFWGSLDSNPECLPWQASALPAKSPVPLLNNPSLFIATHPSSVLVKSAMVKIKFRFQFRLFAKKPELNVYNCQHRRWRSGPQAFLWKFNLGTLWVKQFHEGLFSGMFRQFHVSYRNRSCLCNVYIIP